MTSGYVPRNACPFEVYLNNPQQEKDHIIICKGQRDRREIRWEMEASTNFRTQM